jgi:hypothetical protein
MTGDEDGGTIATFRKVSPIEVVRGPKKERSPEEEAEEAVERIIKELIKLEKQREHAKPKKKKRA